MSKSHFDPYFNEEDGAPDRTMCGIEPGERYIPVGDWQHVTCKRCLSKRKKLDEEVASIEADILNQMGAFVDAQEPNDD